MVKSGSNTAIEPAIGPALLARIRADAWARFPREACGLLIGTSDWRVLGAVAARNVSDRPERAFEIDPAAVLRTHRRARARGLKVLGHYHSHPNGVDRPSPRDLARAEDPDEIWIVCAVSAAGAAMPRAWRLDRAAGRIEERPIRPTAKRSDGRSAQARSRYGVIRSVRAFI